MGRWFVFPSDDCHLLNTIKSYHTICYKLCLWSPKSWNFYQKKTIFYFSLSSVLVCVLNWMVLKIVFQSISIWLVFKLCFASSRCRGLPASFFKSMTSVFKTLQCVLEAKFVTCNEVLNQYRKWNSNRESIYSGFCWGISLRECEKLLWKKFCAKRAKIFGHVRFFQIGFLVLTLS